MKRMKRTIWENLGRRILLPMFLIAGLYLVWPIIKWLFIDAVFWPIAAESCQNAAGDPLRGACWPAVMDTFRLLLVGRYPSEEQWRVTAAVVLIAVTSMLFWRRSARVPITAKPVPFILFIFAVIASGILVAGNTAVGLAPVETGLWGGLLLSFILSVLGVTAGSLLGLALALGRASPLAVPRLLSTAYIETVRGVPLITVLFFAMYVFPLFLPSGWSNISEFGRAAVAIILFEAAYFAEVIRAGLGAVPLGQYEAAKALGLNGVQRLRLVIMPQAFKISLPALIATTIGLVKDTSLVAIIGMFDLLGAARNVPSIPKWIGRDLEPLIFAACFYLVLSLTLDGLAKKFELQRSPAV